MRKTDVRWMALSVAVVLSFLALATAGLSRPSTAEAHPLGNFTVNRYSRLELYSDAVRVRYVLDMAEIPAFQEMSAIDTDGNGEPSAEESQMYLSARASEIIEGLQLSLDGSAVDLALATQEISFPEGQAGLDTLRISMLLESSVDASNRTIEYRDENYSDRIGWKEIVVQPAEGVALSQTSAATEDVSQELTAYPEDLLSSPLDVTTASLSFDATEGVAAPAIEASLAPERATARAGGGFASLIDTDNMTLPVLILTLLLALGFGAIHALEPGHGKTFVAAYFVGVKGTARQAMSLGLIIAATHTVGVLAIGLVTLFGSQFILPERLYPWLSLASGLMILALGVRLFLDRSRNWRLRQRFFAIIRRRPEHDHSHDHDHAHGHSHSHEPPDGSRPWRSLMLLGLADGLTPSPSALVVLLAAVSLDRIGLGLLLIVAFSVGLAAVLTLVCLGLIYARRFLDWVSARKSGLESSGLTGWIAGNLSAKAGLMRVAPVGAAFALIAVGLALTIRALSHQDLPVL